MKRYISLLLLGCLVISFGCKKGSSKSRTELITSATWKFESAAVDANMDGVAESPVPPGYLEDCDLDNTVLLKTDGSGVVDEGGTKCDLNNPQTIDITWTFKDNEKVINIPQTIFGSISGDAEIKILTESKLQLLKQITVNVGVPVTANVIIDLKH